MLESKALKKTKCVVNRMANTLGYDLEDALENAVVKPQNKIAIIAIAVIVGIVLLFGLAAVVAPQQEEVTQDTGPKGSFATGFEVSDEDYSSKGVVQCYNANVVNCLQISMNVDECPPDCNYDPQVLTIKAGTTVEWANYDDDKHTATFAEAGFSSPPLTPIEENENGQIINYDDSHWIYKFDEPGTFNYYDLKTPEIKGTIVVE